MDNQGEILAEPDELEVQTAENSEVQKKPTSKNQKRKQRKANAKLRKSEEQQENEDPLQEKDSSSDGSIDEIEVKKEVVEDSTMRIISGSSHRRYLQTTDNVVTTYPDDTQSHPARKFLKYNIRKADDGNSFVGHLHFKPETKDHCVICLKKEHETDTNLVQCEGLMSGFVEDEETKKEEKRKCNSLFHPTCILNHNAGSFAVQYAALPECQNAVLCPLHCCETCNLERRKQTAYYGKMAQCLKCLRAFHFDTCAPAGCLDLQLKVHFERGTKQQIREVEMIICPAHREDKVSQKDWHVPVCCDCEEDRDEPLLNCRYCIRATHRSCRSCKTMDGEDIPDDVCEGCAIGEHVRTDYPVVARWKQSKKLWPAHTRYWSECPMVLRKDKNYDKIGYALVQWVGEPRPSFSIVHLSDILPMFARSIKLFGRNATPKCKELWQEMVDTHENEAIVKKREFKEVNKPIETSTYYNKASRVTQSEPIESCECKKDAIDRCGVFSYCTTRLEGKECTTTCGKDNNGSCNNRRIIDTIVNKSIERKKTEEKGYGVFATAFIRKDEFIAEYAGEILDKVETERRKKYIREAKDSEANLYTMECKNGKLIDAARMGNIARYINHSCDPNCTTQIVKVPIKENGRNALYDDRVAIVAIKDIPADTEITFMYQMGTDYGVEAPDCCCGAEVCFGKLGALAMQERKKEKKARLDAERAEREKAKKAAKNNKRGGKKSKNAPEPRKRKTSPTIEVPTKRPKDGSPVAIESPINNNTLNVTVQSFFKATVGPNPDEYDAKTKQIYQVALSKSGKHELLMKGIKAMLLDGRPLPDAHVDQHKSVVVATRSRSIVQVRERTTGQQKAQPSDIPSTSTAAYADTPIHNPPKQQPKRATTFPQRRSLK